MPAKLWVGKPDTGVGEVWVPVSVVAGVVILVVEVRAGVTVSVVVGVVSLVVEVRIEVTIGLVGLELTVAHSEEMSSSIGCALLSAQEV